MCVVALAALAEAKRFTAIDAHVHLITTTNGDPVSNNPLHHRPTYLDYTVTAPFHSPARALSAAGLLARDGLASGRAPPQTAAHLHPPFCGTGITYEWAKDPASLQPPEKCPCR